VTDTEERMALVHARLDAWLADCTKLEDPIETAMDDLHAFLEELEIVVSDECAHAKTRCWPCVQAGVSGVRGVYNTLRELWEARA